jgi:hypothetical protein
MTLPLKRILLSQSESAGVCSACALLVAMLHDVARCTLRVLRLWTFIGRFGRRVQFEQSSPRLSLGSLEMKALALSDDMEPTTSELDRPV